MSSDLIALRVEEIERAVDRGTWSDEERERVMLICAALWQDAQIQAIDRAALVCSCYADAERMHSRIAELKREVQGVE